MAITHEIACMLVILKKNYTANMSCIITHKYKMMKQ